MMHLDFALDMLPILSNLIPNVNLNNPTFKNGITVTTILSPKSDLFKESIDERGNLLSKKTIDALSKDVADEIKKGIKVVLRGYRFKTSEKIQWCTAHHEYFKIAIKLCQAQFAVSYTLLIKIDISVTILSINDSLYITSHSYIFKSHINAR